MAMMMSWIIVFMMGGLLWISAGLVTGLYLARMLYPSNDTEGMPKAADLVEPSTIKLQEVGG